MYYHSLLQKVIQYPISGQYQVGQSIQEWTK